MNNIEKLKSFIKFAKTEMTHISCLVNEFDNFMNSNFENAEEYFKSIGMIYNVQKQPSDVEICKEIFDTILNFKESSFKSEIQYLNNSEPNMDKQVIAYTIKHFRGIVDPRRVKEIFKELFE